MEEDDPVPGAIDYAEEDPLADIHDFMEEDWFPFDDLWTKKYGEDDFVEEDPEI